MKIIMPEMKDAVLNYLIDVFEDNRVYFVYTSDVLQKTGLDFNTIDAIIRYFNRVGITDDACLTNMTLNFYLNAPEAHDLQAKGGFEGVDLISKMNVEKLLIEIQSLKKNVSPDNLDTLNKVSGIANALIAFATLYKP